jgi:L-fuconolactonase
LKIDTHQHFWTYTPTDYPWIGPGMDVLAQDRMPNDLVPLLAETGISGTIAVQARQQVAETEWLLKLAEDNPVYFGRGRLGRSSKPRCGTAA